MGHRFSMMVVAVMLAFSLAVFGAEPSSGTLDSQNGEVTWSGGAFYVSNPTTTSGLTKQAPCDVGAPACDNFRLTVTANGVKQVLIAIAPDSGFEADDYNLYVYDDRGVIGGIRWPDTSFFVVSDIRNIEDPQTGTTGRLNALGLNPNVDATAEVFAHEMGHLMGAHHHYANCAEGNVSSAGPSDLSPCTLMFPAVNFASLNFAALEGATVRGHAVNYAKP